MKGHVRERGKGHWYAVVDIRDSVTGKRKKKWHSLPGCKGKREAQEKCALIIADLAKGQYVEPSRETVEVYLTAWLGHAKTQVSPKTFERYSGIVKQNLIPALGPIVLSKLKPAQISVAYSAALESGRRKGSGGLSPRTVGHMHRVLHQALGQAVKWEKLARNPATSVDPPKVEWRPMKTYDLSQTADVLDHVRGSPIFVPVLLAVLCGLRRGEICALRWRNVDLAAGQMSVVESLEQTKGGKSKGLRFKSPKSGKGRTVALSQTVVDELRAHRAKRAEELLRLGVRLSDDDLVMVQPDGSVMAPIYISQLWARVIARTKLARLRFHDLRHAHATHLLANGVHPKIASERLGHSKVGITLDLYSHVIPGMQEDAAAMVDAALKAAAQKREQKSSNPVAGRISGTDGE
ncbi:tyrosine-type recombinase/integrase [Bradyrhizobium sp. USDA 4486]